MRSGLLGVIALAVIACASPGVPPGGPVDTEAPQIVKIAPDSGRTGTTPREVIFRFNEVVSETPSGAPSLSALFLVSPRDGEPKVDWHRSEISVRPRRGWRKNTAYTITLLPGLSDLRGNTRNTGAITLFSTGSAIPTGRISGTIYSWPEARVFQRALIEARPRADTTVVYVTSSDSLGNFVVAPLPAGAYQLRGIADENNNKGLDPRESWDSAAVSVTDSTRADIYAFVHDSVGARIASVAVKDSVTLEVTFDNPLAPIPAIGPANVRVRASDSTDVPVLSVSPPAVDTTVAGIRRLTRLVPPRTLTVKLGRPLRVKYDYRVRVTDARNLVGVLRSSEKIVSVPAPAPPPVPGPARAPAIAPTPPVKR